MATPAYADGLSVFIDPLKQGLNLIVVFGFIAGCVMVIGGFLNARRDENWKMTVIYGIGVAGAVGLMKALFLIFGGNAATTVAWVLLCQQLWTRGFYSPETVLGP